VAGAVGGMSWSRQKKVKRQRQAENGVDCGGCKRRIRPT
jgi:hypothetical protein